MKNDNRAPHRVRTDDLVVLRLIGDDSSESDPLTITVEEPKSSGIHNEFGSNPGKGVKKLTLYIIICMHI